jgi:hypothetical protein
MGETRVFRSDHLDPDQMRALRWCLVLSQVNSNQSNNKIPLITHSHELGHLELSFVVGEN